MDRDKVIEELKDYRDRDFIKEGTTVFDNDPRYRKMLINDALALIDTQHKLILELQNLISIGTKMMNGDKA